MCLNAKLKGNYRGMDGKVRGRGDLFIGFVPLYIFPTPLDTPPQLTPHHTPRHFTPAHTPQRFTSVHTPQHPLTRHPSSHTTAPHSALPHPTPPYLTPRATSTTIPQPHPPRHPDNIASLFQISSSSLWILSLPSRLNSFLGQILRIFRDF